MTHFTTTPVGCLARCNLLHELVPHNNTAVPVYLTAVSSCIFVYHFFFFFPLLNFYFSPYPKFSLPTISSSWEHTNEKGHEYLEHRSFLRNSTYLLTVSKNLSHTLSYIIRQDDQIPLTECQRAKSPSKKSLTMAHSPEILVRHHLCARNAL